MDKEKLVFEGWEVDFYYGKITGVHIPYDRRPGERDLELVVFRLPKDSDAIAEIELFLQEKYG